MGAPRIMDAGCGDYEIIRGNNSPAYLKNKDLAKKNKKPLDINRDGTALTAVQRNGIASTRNGVAYLLTAEKR